MAFFTKRRMFAPLATTTAVVAMHGLVGVWLAAMPAHMPTPKQPPIKINFIQDTKPPVPVVETPAPTTKPTPAPKPTPKKPQEPKPAPKPKAPPTTQPPQKTTPTPTKPVTAPAPTQPALTKNTTSTVKPIEHAITVQKAQAAAFSVQQNSTPSTTATPSPSVPVAENKSTPAPSQAKTETAPSTKAQAAANAPTAPTATPSTNVAPTAQPSTNAKASAPTASPKETGAGKSSGTAKSTDTGNKASSADSGKKSLTLSSAEVNASWDKKPDLGFGADEGFKPKNKTVTATFSFDERGKISGVSITSTGDRSMDKEIKRRFASAKLKAQGGSGTASVQLLIN